MHVYGSMAQPGVLDRWPAPSAPIGRVTLPKPVTWPVPNVATRVDLPPPAIWGAPNPELLLSITIAPLRFLPVSWGPPEFVQSPWAPPAIDLTSDSADADTVGRARSGRPRALAFGLAAATAMTVGAIALLVAR